MWAVGCELWVMGCARKPGDQGSRGQGCRGPGDHGDPITATPDLHQGCRGVGSRGPGDQGLIAANIVFHLVEGG